MKKKLLIILPLLVWAGTFICGQNATDLNPDQEKGKLIYTKGISPTNGEIIAVMSSVNVPAAVLPCASCHGLDGKGRPEGGITPSNLTWKSLTKAYVSSKNSSREHPPYDEKSLISAFSIGIDPAGNTLHTSMPRYRMSKEDAEYLVAYIKALGQEKEIGVSDTSIDIGMHFSLTNSTQQAAFEITKAYFSELNANGGIYGRQLNLKHLKNLEQAPKEVFAMTGGYYQDANQSFNNWAQEYKVPIVGTIADKLAANFQDNHYIFYLYPGLSAQIDVLVSTASKKPLILSTNSAMLNLLDQSLSTASTFNIAERGTTIDALVKKMKAEGWEIIIPLLAPDQLELLFATAVQQNYYPEFLLVGSLVQMDLFTLPTELDGKILISYPTWPTYQSKNGLKEYFYLQQKYKLNKRFKQAQLTSLAGAMMLVEGLTQTGRQLSQVKLIDQLQQMYDFNTGLIPPLSYSKNKRLGSEKVFLARLGLADQTLELLRTLE